jgi:DNA polymerase elongation subunit (family B)
MVAQEEAQYKATTLARCALLGLQAAGVRVPPGDSVAYVVTDAASPRPRQRCVEARLLKGDERYDAGFYARLVLRALESLALPFGWTAERLAPVLGGPRAPLRRTRARPARASPSGLFQPLA